MAATPRECSEALAVADGEDGERGDGIERAGGACLVVAGDDRASGTT